MNATQMPTYQLTRGTAITLGTVRRAACPLLVTEEVRGDGAALDQLPRMKVTSDPQDETHWLVNIRQMTREAHLNVTLDANGTAHVLDSGPGSEAELTLDLGDVSHTDPQLLSRLAQGDHSALMKVPAGRDGLAHTYVMGTPEPSMITVARDGDRCLIQLDDQTRYFISGGSVTQETQWGTYGNDRRGARPVAQLEY